MAQLGIILALIIVLGGGAWKMHDWGYDSGFATSESEVLKVKNAEIVDLNRQNKEMQDTIDRERRENIDEHFTREVGARKTLKAIEHANDVAMDDLSTALRMQLDAAQNAGKNKDYSQEGGFTAFISGLAGTEGSKLTPETRYDLERLSLTNDKTTVLFGLCIAQAIDDRK